MRHRAVEREVAVERQPGAVAGRGQRDVAPQPRIVRIAYGRDARRARPDRRAAPRPEGADRACRQEPMFGIRLHNAKLAAPFPRKERRLTRACFADTPCLSPLELGRHDQQLQPLLARLGARDGLARGRGQPSPKQLLGNRARVRSSDWRGGRQPRPRAAARAGRRGRPRRRRYQASPPAPAGATAAGRADWSSAAIPGLRLERKTAHDSDEKIIGRHHFAGGPPRPRATPERLGRRHRSPPVSRNVVSRRATSAGGGSSATKWRASLRAMWRAVARVRAPDREARPRPVAGRRRDSACRARSSRRARAAPGRRRTCRAPIAALARLPTVQPVRMRARLVTSSCV